MHEITEKWYGAADDFKPKTKRDYLWVWEYSKFRFEWACSNGRYIEDKAINLFKFLMAIAAGFGALISFLVSQKAVLTPWSYGLGLLALLALVISGISLLITFDPSNHLYPIKEQAALECIDAHGPDEDCHGNMALAMTASIEFERQAINNKAKWLRIALGAACASIGLFIFALFFELHP